MADRLEEIRAAGAQLIAHMNYGDGYEYVRRCVAEPRITVSSGGPKNRKSKRKYYRVFMVEGVDSEFATLEEAVLAVEKLDRRKAEDAEWEAAEIKAVSAAFKKPKPCAIEL